MSEYKQEYQRWSMAGSPSRPPARSPGVRAAGQVLFGFHNAFPKPSELARCTAGFDRWAIFTLEQPLAELENVYRVGAAPFEFDGLAPWSDDSGPPLGDQARNGAVT